MRCILIDIKIDVFNGKIHLNIILEQKDLEFFLDRGKNREKRREEKERTTSCCCIVIKYLKSNKKLIITKAKFATYQRRRFSYKAA